MFVNDKFSDTWQNCCSASKVMRHNKTRQKSGQNKQVAICLLIPPNQVAAANRGFAHAKAAEQSFRRASILNRFAFPTPMKKPCES